MGYNLAKMAPAAVMGISSNKWGSAATSGDQVQCGRRHTLAKGAKQFVVHDAFETTSMLLLSYFFSLTPITNIGASADGAEMTTCTGKQASVPFTTLPHSAQAAVCCH